LEADQRRRVGSLPEVHLAEGPTNSVSKPNPHSPSPPTPPSQSAYTQKASVNSLQFVNTNIYSESDLEDITGVLSFRLPIKYIVLYDKLSKKEKRLVKQALAGIIEAVARGAGAALQQLQRGQQVVVNLNLNVVEAQQGVQVGAPDEVLLERVRLLERKYRQAEQLLRHYRETLRKLKIAASQGDARSVLAALRSLEL